MATYRVTCETGQGTFADTGLLASTPESPSTAVVCASRCLVLIPAQIGQLTQLVTYTGLTPRSIADHRERITSTTLLANFPDLLWFLSIIFALAFTNRASIGIGHVPFRTMEIAFT